MSEEMPFEGTLSLSRQIDYFCNDDEFYVYHNLFGYILKMSEDVVEFLEYFRAEPRTPEETLERFAGQFSRDMIADFATVFVMQCCLLKEPDAGEKKVLEMFPMHARWIVADQTDPEAIKLYAVDRDTNASVNIITPASKSNGGHAAATFSL